MLEIIPEINLEIIARLRQFAAQGVRPSQMLRDILNNSNWEEPRSQALVLHCIKAFDFQVNQVSSIFGWYAYPGYTPELSDAKLDYFFGRHLNNAGWPVKIPETFPNE